MRCLYSKIKWSQIFDPHGKPGIEKDCRNSFENRETNINH